MKCNRRSGDTASICAKETRAVQDTGGPSRILMHCGPHELGSAIHPHKAVRRQKHKVLVDACYIENNYMRILVASLERLDQSKTVGS